MFKGGQQMAALLALITDIHSLGLPAAQGARRRRSTGTWTTRPRMVEALFRQDEPDADDVAGRRLFFRDVLSQRRQGRRHRRAAQGGGQMREKPIEDFFARNGKLREDDLIHDLMLVQVKTRVVSVGLLQGARQDLRRRGIRPDRSGLRDGEEINSSSSWLVLHGRDDGGCSLPRSP